jgi:hydroxyethylthiazole kinase-like uncharacterized protein yjeF
MSLPGWLEPLPDGELMRATDRWAIEERGIPSLDLMERAGIGLAREVSRRIPDGRIAVVCGKGNNGGDGYVAARHLRAEGRDVDVLTLVDVGELEGDARANLERLEGDPPREFAAAALDGAACVVDAMLGTGFSGEPREPVAGAIAAINASGARVVAADIPSGTDASTGEVAAEAVRAEATATFHAAKPALWIEPGKTHAGETVVIDIGIPSGAPGEAAIGLIAGAVLDLIPPRYAGSTKFHEGAVLVAGGSRGLTGAPILAARAAARAGAGYVTACIPRALNSIFEVALLEAMTLPLPDEDASHTPDGVEVVAERAAKAQALVLGPGLGRADKAVLFARALAAWAELPLLLDADGLNAHAEVLEQLASRHEPTVLTPHAGELSRLLQTDSAAVEQRRLHHARLAAERANAVVVLKGDDTLVVDPGGTVAISRGDAPGLATAGTGDVLSGTIGAMLAKDLDPFAAACAGVELHRRAGRLAAEAQGGPGGVIASDVIAALPHARNAR